MALQKAYDRFGDTFPVAYHWISDVIFNFREKRVEIYITIHITDALRQASRELVDKKTFIVANTIDPITGLPINDFDTYFSTLNLTNQHPVAICYKYIKDKIAYYGDAANV